MKNKNCIFPEIHDNCGVFGIYAPGEDVARYTYFGLYALQHRGQESAGIATSSGQDIVIFKDMGLVAQVFDERILSILKGIAALGHVRYSTTGSSSLCNAQPILIDKENYPNIKRKIALAHNGNLVNTPELRKRLANKGFSFISTSDSELIACLIASSEKENIVEAIKETMSIISGAYSLGILYEDKLIAVRDPYGFRPFCLGKLNGNFVITSESCALDVVGATFLREIEPGEIVIIDENGITSQQGIVKKQDAVCIFEFIYFARPDSYINGKSLYMCRRRMGEILAKEHPTNADIVINVPDSSTPSAIGYAHQSNIPYVEGLIKNRYIHRTFIQPQQKLRERGVRMKLNPLQEMIAGKRIVMVDDSIVRGTTAKKIVRLLKDSGAKEVHVRVSSPPIRYPCHYGIDMAHREELIASERNTEAVRNTIEADSLHYLSMNGLIEAIGLPKENFCLACFNDSYPLKVAQQLELAKFVLEKAK